LFLESSQSMILAPYRKVEAIFTSRITVEGGGVRLKRAFAEDTLMDPFLLLDEFHSHNPRDYSAGFPWHPHRGFETVTYMLEGEIEHQDSAENKGLIRPGEVQWMTAGRGIVHQEMPRGDEKKQLWGLQLWVNLPAAMKMGAPKYREVRREQIPEVQVAADSRVRVICGSVEGKAGPVRDLAVDCQFLDVTVRSNGVFEHSPPRSHRVFAYVLDGEGRFEQEKTELVRKEHTVVYGQGERIRILAGNETLRCLLVSGEPIREPVAWRGSVVMNTPQELAKAYEELSKGRFLNRQ
jgi:quercetin 2,3-dioxygenase